MEIPGASLHWWQPLFLLHIPDGFLSVPIMAVCWLLTLGALAMAMPRVRAELGERQIPLTGVMAAFIFGAQMINFPIAGGTSGHLLGGTLAAATLGPWPGMIVMTSVLALQALLFQDGGLVALGANVLNMGVVTVMVGYGLYRSVLRAPLGLRLGVTGVAAWLSVMAAALLTSLQLWLSGTVSLELVLPAMLGVHALIGIGEALITVAALAFILRTRPDIVTSRAGAGGRGWIAVGLAVTLAVVLLAPLASQDPDGLERVAEDLGFIVQAADAPYSILPDYTVPGLASGAISTVAAGFVGVLLVAALAAGAVWLVRRAGPPSADRSRSAP